MATTQLLNGQSGLPVDNSTKSYWHSAPSEKLMGHRTTEQLPHSADVVIVGSGITGAFAAHCLKEQRPELDVVMLEAREACWGATGRNGGHCQPAMYAAKPHIASFELRTFSYIKSIVEEYSIPCDWKTTTGVHAFYSASFFKLVQDVIEKLADNYPDLAANVAVVTKGEGGSPAWLLEHERKELTLEGLRIPEAEGAVVMFNAASLWPYKLVASMLERLLAAEAGGFNLQTKTPATGIQKVEPQHPKWIVHTPRGHIAAKSVLLATNAYTSHLLPQFTDLIVPTRGQVSSLLPPQEPQPGEAPLDIGHTYYILGDATDRPLRRDDYLVQRPPPKAELVLGGGRFLAKDNAVGVWDDGELDEPVKWWLRGELPAAMDLSLRTPEETTTSPVHAAQGENNKQDLEASFEWTGIMGYSRDAAPWVGAVPSSLGGGEGLWVCAGYTGHGMPNAALCAKAVVDMMVGADEVDLPPEYEVTEERVEGARRRDTVRVADARGELEMFAFMD
ncbi:FAD dependent oxidoreductase [Pseudomassariella vexata]|uniref:FAD dependent oxidoreductase n=1 Tax=Pseudomassariella vexata TaxID=1141098 RepID=A0A1Y2EB00_9PEZI|nr:FAD dependent oxidoreductase [Pseudomassariella vexata]ORY68753.1 FAD dependent oxidoreductase [Pseudomassariella vexata]